MGALPRNVCVGVLSHSVMAFGGEAFGRLLCSVMSREVPP